MGVGWVGGVGGMLTFIATARFSWTSAHTSCYVPLGGVGGWGGGGGGGVGGWGGGDVNVHCDCKEGWGCGGVGGVGGGMLTFIATARRGGWGGGWGRGMLTFIATKNKLKNPVNFSVGSHEKIWCAEHEHGFNNHPLSCKHLEHATVKTIKNTANTMKISSF